MSMPFLGNDPVALKGWWAGRDKRVDGKRRLHNEDAMEVSVCNLKWGIKNGNNLLRNTIEVAKTVDF